MHDYSVVGQARERLIFLLAAISFLIVPVVAWVFGWLGVTITISAFSLFALLFWLFNKYIWRFAPIAAILKVPDLNGTWDCVGRRFDQTGVEIEEWIGKVTICQTWSKLSVILTTATSQSASGPASLSKLEDVGWKLVYTYLNQPEKITPHVTGHMGVCSLNFDLNLTRAHGIYFNDHNRQSFGEIELIKQSKRKESK